jgi:hypothetical protein
MRQAKKKVLFCKRKGDLTWAIKCSRHKYDRQGHYSLFLSHEALIQQDPVEKKKTILKSESKRRNIHQCLNSNTFEQHPNPFVAMHRVNICT